MKKYILTVLIIPFFATCNHNPQEIGHYSLSKNELNLIPYSGNDTLIFQDSLHNKIVFMGSERITSTNLYRDPPNVEYPKSYYTDEKNLTPFTSNIMCDSVTYKKPFIITCVNAKVDFKNPNKKSPTEKYIQFSLPDFSHNCSCNTYFHLKIINEKIFLNDSKDKYFEKKIIGGKIFSKVFELNGSNHDIDDLDSNYVYPKTMCYSQTKGIISFKMSNGQNFIISN